MHWIGYQSTFCVFITLLVASFGQLFGQTTSADDRISSPEIDPVVLHEQATRALDTYCVTCHGPEKQKGDLRFDALETMDAVDLQDLYGNILEVVRLGEMPPEKAKQPKETEKKILLQWLDSQLTGEAAKALAEKLARFEYGNVTSHEDLFSGEYADLPGYTPDRRWLISEFIFNGKINRLLNYRPTRKIYGTTHKVQGDSGVHWSPKTEHGNKFRRTITNPFLLPEKVGVRYSSHKRLTTGHLLTMIGNAKRVAGHMSSESIMKTHYPAMYALMETELNYREILRNREQFLRTYVFMERLLKNIYGEEHAKLLPEVVRKDIPYPGPPKHQANGIQKRHENLDFLGRFDQEDLQAILRGITTYKQTEYKVEEILAKSESDNKGNAVWAPYSKANLAEYNHIIEQCERDWFLEGVTDYRIGNRITTMKLFYDTWDMNRLYPHVKKGNFSTPKYTPLNDPEMAAISSTIKKNRKQGDRYIRIIDKCLTDWQAEFKAARESTSGAGNTLVAKFVIELYEQILEREPTDSELDENIGQFKLYLSKLDRQKAIGKLMESLVLSTEFAYRNEFGQREADEYGRRLMSPRNASYALAYALTDDGPDETLTKAAEGGKLDSRNDYEREVRRLLGIRDKWNVIDENVQAANLNPSVTNQPIRKLRFFREFFGYPKAQNVFKDDSRFGAGRHEQAVSRLIEEADMLVEHILKKDEQVFETLLTSDKFYVFHNGDNASMKAASDALKSIYDYFKNKNWQAWKPEDVAPHEAFLRTHWEFQREKQGDHPKILRKLQKMMDGLELHFSEGQTGALPYMKNGMGFWHGGPVLGRSGQQMRGEQVTTYWNLNWKTWDYPPNQPATIPNRKGILTHPAWLIAHAQNLETDPIHRGKWIREKLLAGTIPDIPITVDAVIPPDPHKTLRQRMENRTGESYCWRCHEKMDPLGLPFETYDDFGRYRTAENLEHPENLIQEAKRGEVNAFGASLSVFKTLPVDPRGVLKGTGDPKLDGKVKDAFDLIDRLARSEKVRQSIIRHAFRYFLGRNETLSDSKTLIDADRAYVDNEGSFDEVIVSLLTSDSFIYRKRNTKE
jgi:mono/diheme cytochrome c family protein